MSTKGFFAASPLFIISSTSASNSNSNSNSNSSSGMEKWVARRRARGPSLLSKPTLGETFPPRGLLPLLQQRDGWQLLWRARRDHDQAAAVAVAVAVAVCAFECECE